MDTIKIALTGGPSGGKTMILEKIKEYVRENTDYNLIIVPETATELSNNIIRPQDVLNAYDFQNTVFKRQYFKECEVDDVLKYNDKKKNIIVYDRGIIDNKAYLNQELFDMLLSSYDKKELELLSNYDLVIYLESVSHYDNIEYGFNNKARYEDKKSAAQLDNKTVEAWLGHNNLKVVRARENKQDKIDDVIKIIDDEINDIRKEKIENYELDNESDLSIYDDNNSKLINETDYYLENIDNKGYKYILTKRSYKNSSSYIFKTVKYNLDEKTTINEKNISEKEFLRIACKYGVISIIEKEVLSFYYDRRKFDVISYDGKKRIEFIYDKDLKVPSNIKLKKKIDDMDDFINNQKKFIKKLEI